ncbi:MAG: tocopherol cyclase family protein [Treponema sp.]
MQFILNPMPFQGNLHKRKYFEGWYLKHVSKDKSCVLSFIPGISLTPEDRCCFIQVIDGISGKTWYIKYPLETFQWNSSVFSVSAGTSTFSLNECSINIDESDLKIAGNLNYSEMQFYPRTPGHPGIMGWFSFIPGLECRHDVLSMNHTVSGTLQMNGKLLDFTEGSGYIEKDWGWNFPSSYIWMQCSNFDESGTSFMMAVARVPIVPFAGKGILGFLGFLQTRGKIRTFGTWNRWAVKNCLFPGNGEGTVMLTDGHEQIDCCVKSSSAGMLKAPAKGAMSQIVKESINASVSIRVTGKDRTVFSLEGYPGGFEQRGIFS